jgi:hypothetical protein
MSSTTGSRTRRVLAPWFLAFGVLVTVGGAWAVGPVSAQTDPSPTTAPTTAVPSTTQAPALQERVTESEAATTRLNRVVLALLGLAGVIAAVTVVFWRMTRPDGGRDGASSAYWVDERGAEVPLPEAAGGSAAVADRDAWSVDPPPTLAPERAAPASSGSEPGAQDPLEPPRDPDLAPLVARRPQSAPFPGRPDGGSDDGGPMVIVEPVAGSGAWASQGWGTEGAEPDEPDDPPRPR